MDKQLHLVTCDLQANCTIYMIPYTTMGVNIIILFGSNQNVAEFMNRAKVDLLTLYVAIDII
jgi:hypothetical protein